MKVNKATIGDIMLEKLTGVRQGVKAESAGDNFAETRLFGEGAVFDSIGLVTFLVEVEQENNDRFQLEISLMDERAFSRSQSPFRPIATLIDYVMEMADGKPE